MGDGCGVTKNTHGVTHAEHYLLLRRKYEIETVTAKIQVLLRQAATRLEGRYELSLFRGRERGRGTQRGAEEQRGID